jgi:integrase
MAYIRTRTTGKVDKFDNPILSYQVVWAEPMRDEFGAPTGKFKQTSETFPTERKARAHQRKVETELESAKGIDPSSAKAKANTPLGTYARQYLDSLAGQMEPTTIAGYEKLFLTHIRPVFGRKPVAAITAAEVDRFRAGLIAAHERRCFVRRGKPDPLRMPSPGTRLVTRSPKTVKHIVGTLKRMLDTAVRDGAISANPALLAHGAPPNAELPGTPASPSNTGRCPRMR